MKKFLWFFLGIFLIDQFIKFLLVRYCEGIEGCRIWESNFYSLILVYNKGVAFSLLSFFGDFLKYLQLLILFIAARILYHQREFFIQNQIAFGLIFAGGVSNILDRFIYGGVVDYVYWHYYFEFAVFNFADVMIDLGVVILLYKFYQDYRRKRVISSARK